MVDGLSPDALLCLVDTWVDAFLPPERLSAFPGSVGSAATGTVQSAWSTPHWLRDDRDGGVFGVIGRVDIGNGCGAALRRAHPGAAWLEWTAVP